MPSCGFSALDVVFLAVHEHDNVGILLDRARFTQVGELRALVLAVLDLARELRQGDDRHGQLLGQRLQAGRDLRDLLHAAFRGAPRRAGQQLQIVDDQQAEPCWRLSLRARAASCAMEMPPVWSM